MLSDSWSIRGAVDPTNMAIFWLLQVVSTLDIILGISVLVLKDTFEFVLGRLCFALLVFVVFGL